MLHACSTVAAWSYLPKQAPRYMTGNGLNIAAVITSQILAAALMFYNRRENRLREQGARDYILEGKTQEEIDELGNQHPNFRFKW
jgi:hypothetical protein